MFGPPILKTLCVLVFFLVSFQGCAPAQAPPPYETIVLEGTPYERGFAHGERFSGKIRSFYAGLLTNSIIPNLNRDRPQIADFFIEYQHEDYDDGRFAQKVFLESAYQIEESIPEHFIEEMRGIADGAGLTYEQILVLNTFVDTILGVRTVQLFLNESSAPKLTSLEMVLEAGEQDERWRADPFLPLTHAHFVDVPTDAALRFVLSDESEVDPETLRIHLGGELYTATDSSLSFSHQGESREYLEVVFSPPGGLRAASIINIGIEAGNKSIIEEPPPKRARFMRPQWISIATQGVDKQAHQIPNMAAYDERFPPPPIAFAAEKTATLDGLRRLAHHFALFDAGTAHKHVVLFKHKPRDGLPHVSLGWAGLVGGFSGMNSAGLAWSVNHSDSLDNPVVGEIRRNLIAARILSGGLPIWMTGREILTRAQDVDAATSIIIENKATVGWNHLVAGVGGLRIVEADGDIQGHEDRAEHVYGPDRLDEDGVPFAAIGAHDLRISSHYISNSDDIETSVFGFNLLPQRYWGSYWYRSLRVFSILGDLMQERIGEIDSSSMIEIMRTPELIHPRDSMNAVVYEPEQKRLWLAAGQVPATDAPFVLHELEWFFGDD